ncbi:MAG: hypothetical protein ACRC8A_08400 [Microcoleaceae cyanobacterium]
MSHQLELVHPQPSLEPLKSALLKASTIHELTALIVDSTHEEILHVYHRLSEYQQTRILAIWFSQQSFQISGTQGKSSEHDL